MAWLEDSSYDRFNRRLAILEGWSINPVDNAGSPLPTDLSTGLVLGLLTSVAPAMNSTNNRVNAIATRVNLLQQALVDKGIMAP